MGDIQFSEVKNSLDKSLDCWIHWNYICINIYYIYIKNKLIVIWRNCDLKLFKKKRNCAQWRAVARICAFLRAISRNKITYFILRRKFFLNQTSLSFQSESLIWHEKFERILKKTNKGSVMTEILLCCRTTLNQWMFSFHVIVMILCYSINICFAESEKK